MNERTDGWTNKQADGRTNGQIYELKIIETTKL